jgi:hypothetical protein
MTDKQAGKLLKGICGYVFDSNPFTSNDCTVKGVFTLIKTMIDKDEKDRENGRKGGIISAEKSKKRGGILVITETKERIYPTLKVLQDILSDATENAKKSEGENVART